MSRLFAIPACSGCHSSFNAFGLGFGGRADHVSRRGAQAAGSNTMPSFVAKLAMNAARIPAPTPCARTPARRRRANAAPLSSSGSPSCACAGRRRSGGRGEHKERCHGAGVERPAKGRHAGQYNHLFLRGVHAITTVPSRPRSGAIRPWAARRAHSPARSHCSSPPSTCRPRPSRKRPLRVAAPWPRRRPFRCRSCVAPASTCCRDRVIAGASVDERRDPASLTKLMTAYLVFGALRAKTITPSQMVNVSPARVEAPKARGCSSSRASAVSASTSSCAA